MNPPSVDIANLLSYESHFALVIGENLFIGKEPAKPNSCVTIFDSPGRPHDITLGGQTDPLWEYPAIAIRCRSIDYILGWSLIFEITNFLHALNNIIEGGSKYALMSCMGSPHFHDWDENGRVRFLSIFNILRTEI